MTGPSCIAICPLSTTRSISESSRSQPSSTRRLRCYAPILADHLLAKLDGQELTFRCVERSHRVLDHLQCDFRFQADWKPVVDARHELSFREGNYETETGMIRLSIGNTPATPFLNKTEPDEALKARPLTQLRPGDEERLRGAAAWFELRSERGKDAPAGIEGVASVRRAGGEAPGEVKAQPQSVAGAAVVKSAEGREEEPAIAREGLSGKRAPPARRRTAMTRMPDRKAS